MTDLPFKIWFDKSRDLIQIRVHGMAQNNGENSDRPYIGLWSTDPEQFFEVVKPQIISVAGEEYEDEILPLYMAALQEQFKFWDSLDKSVLATLQIGGMPVSELASRLGTTQESVRKSLRRLESRAKVTDYSETNIGHTLVWRLRPQASGASR